MAVSVKFSTMTGFHICMLILWLYCDGWTVGIHCGCFTRPGGSGWRQWGLVGGRMCQIPWCCHSVSLHSPVMVFRQILIHGITYKTQGTVGKSLFERLIQILISQMAFLVQLNGPNRSGSILHNPFSHSFTNSLFPPASCYKSCNPTNNHCLIENPIQFRILKFPTKHKELIRPCRCAVDSAKNWWAHIREWHGAGMHWQKHWQMLHRYGHLEMQAWVLCRYILNPLLPMNWCTCHFASRF